MFSPSRPLSKSPPLGANGLGKTCIAKNIAYAAVTAGKV
jgi:hypothetical protein